MELATAQSIPSFCKSLCSLCSTSTSSPVLALVVHPFASQALEIAKDLNLLSFVCFPLSAMITSFHLYCPKLHEQVSGEYKDHPDLIQIKVFSLLYPYVRLKFHLSINTNTDLIDFLSP